ncbi:MAG: hypothetical protein Q9195_001928 [Heterodermia aff. obscurata]
MLEAGDISLQVSQPETRPEAVSGEPSMLFKILPSAVQTRISQLPSIRKAISACNLRTDRHDHSIPEHTWSQSLQVGFVEVASVNSSPRRHSSKSSVSSSSSADACCENVPSRELRYATNGINLLEAVVSEGQCTDSKSQAVSRQQFIHSLAYLLHGIPDDLSSHEKETLLGALPEQLQRHQEHSQMSDHQPSRGPSLVHRFFASGIIQIFLFFQVFLPYLKHLVRLAYQFERTNHISERVLEMSIAVINGISKKGSSVIGTFVRSEYGRIAQLAAAISIWWIKEVSNGIQDGVEGCVDIVDEAKGQRPGRAPK